MRTKKALRREWEGEDRIRRKKKNKENGKKIERIKRRKLRTRR